MLLSRVKQMVVGVQVILLVLFSFADVALAGFGITPPYVRNTSLTRNSTYEQQILMVRGTPDSGQIAEIQIDAPEIESWIEIVEGTPIALPRGVQKVPVTVRVRVPADAEFKDYNGVIRIRTLPDNDSVSAGSVNISLGARVDINLTVIDREILDFRVRKVSVPDLNEGGKLAWLYFPGKIRFSMLIENTGNVDVAPSLVEFKIYNRNGTVLLEDTKNLGSIKKIKPYAAEEVLAQIPTRLPAGNYIARYKVFNGSEVKQEGDISLNILPAGTLQVAGFGFMGLSLAHKVSVTLPLFVLVIVILYTIYQSRLRRRSRF